MGPTHPWWSFVGSYVARRRLVGKEKDIKQSLPFLVKGRKRQLRSIFPNGVILAPHSNSNWELQKGQFWNGKKSFKKRKERRRHMTTWRHSHILSSFPKTPFLSHTHYTPLGLLQHTHLLPLVV